MSLIPNYPQQVSLRDGSIVTLRPFMAEDADALFDFFQRLPVETRRFAWDRIDLRSTIEHWAGNIDYGKVFPLIALDGSKIVADATLHRRESGPLRLVGRIKWLIDPEYRKIGIGSVLVNQMIDSGTRNGLRHLTCMLISDLEADAVETLTELGFVAYPMHEYGVDPDGGSHDMTKLIYRL
jgi:GNAT superfamily N-acetyltransferase